GIRDDLVTGVQTCALPISVICRKRTMPFVEYISGLQEILERIKREQAHQIEQAGRLAADALAADGVIHAFGTGHSHLIAEEAFRSEERRVGKGYVDGCGRV